MGRCPRHTGAEGSYPAVDIPPVQRLEDRIHHSIEFCLHVTVPEPKDAVAGRSQEAVAAIVILGALEMLAPVEFNDQLSVERGEVADVEADLMLSAELEASDLSASQTAPEKTLGRCLVIAESAHVAKHVRIELYDLGDNMSKYAIYEGIRMTPPPP